MFLLYPDSAPDDYQEKLEDLGQPIALSPWHDRDPKEISDKSDLTQEELALFQQGKLFKKKHKHGIYIANNPVTVDAVRNKLKRALGDKAIAIVKICDNVESYYKYLTHESKDAIRKNKPKYDSKDIVLLNNFDIDRYVTVDESVKKEMFNAITKAILDNQLENIFDLSDYILEHGKEIGIETLGKMNDVVAPRTGLLRIYFDGAYQRRKRGKVIDKETGEIKYGKRDAD